MSSSFPLPAFLSGDTSGRLLARASLMISWLAIPSHSDSKFLRRDPPPTRSKADFSSEMFGEFRIGKIQGRLLFGDVRRDSDWQDPTMIENNRQRTPSWRLVASMDNPLTIEKVIAKFAQLTPQEREKRKLEGLEALKRTFKKSGHDVNIPDFLGSSSQTIEELSNHLRNMQSRMSDLERRLRCWTDPRRVNSLEQIKQMEDSLRQSLSQVQLLKKYNVRQPVPLDCVSELNRGMDQMHMAMASGQHQPQMQWLTGVPAILPPQRNLGVSSTAMLQGYIGYFNPGNQASCSRHEPEQPVNDPGQSSSLPTQPRPQYPYHHSYGLNLLGDRDFKPTELNLQEGLMRLQARGLEPPRLGFDAASQTWASTSASCGVTKFDAQPYPQPKQS